MYTTSFDIKTHIAHTFRPCVPFRAGKSSDYFDTQHQPIGFYNGSRLFSVRFELYLCVCNMGQFESSWRPCHGSDGWYGGQSALGRFICQFFDFTVGIIRRVYKACLHLDITLTRRTSGRSLTPNSALMDVSAALDRKLRSLCQSIHSESWTCLSTKL